MATSNGERVAAFLLAAVFLFSTIGATAYVIWEINQQEGGIVQEAEDLATPPTEESAEQAQADACGNGTFEAGEPRPIPAVTTAEVPVAELQKIDVKAGEGEEVQAGDCVAVMYYGTLAATGAKFDGNYETGQPIELSLNGVIKGWGDGIPGMKVGGVRRLVIPAVLGYGEQEAGTIPANSDLIFEVEIVATKRGV